MDNQKRKAISDLIQTVNELDLASVMLLANGANMLRARESIDLSALVDQRDADGSDLRAG